MFSWDLSGGEQRLCLIVMDWQAEFGVLQGPERVSLCTQNYSYRLLDFRWFLRKFYECASAFKISGKHNHRLIESWTHKISAKA